MQRKGPPDDLDIKVVLQFFNTPGNEIAPGSDIVGKYFQHWFLCHFFLLIYLKAVSRQYAVFSFP